MLYKALNWLSRHYLAVLFILLLPMTVDRVNSSIRGVIWSDAEGYYVYNPAVFCLGDLRSIPEGSMLMHRNERDEVINKYTCGVAYFQTPFFLVAKWYSDTHGFPANDIYNANYARSVALTGYCVGFIGLFFLAKALREAGFGRRRKQRDNEEENTNWLIPLTILSIFGGTNLFHYTTKEMGMSHVYSFCLFSVLMWFLPRFYAGPTWKKAFTLGILVGWIALIRPTNIVALAIVPFFGVYSWANIRERVFFWAQNWRNMIVVVLGGLVPVGPQLYYWRVIMGKWVVDSYQEETFKYWNAPKLLEVWFDPQNGLFLYSPVVLLAMIGLVWGWLTRRFHAPVVTVVFLVLSYLFASWWAWWFGGAFGARSFVELYALLAFPLAGVLERILAIKPRFLRYLVVFCLLFLVYYSIRLSFNYMITPNGPWDGVEWRWNWDKMMEVWRGL